MLNKAHTIQGMKQQQGVVLLVALVMLLVITILGVSAVNIAGDKTQIAGNSMYTMLVYQGAESTLARSVSGQAKLNIKNAAAAGGVFTVPAAHITDSTEVVNGLAKMISKATITPLNNASCSVIGGNAGSSGTGFECKVFSVSATTSLVATGARTRHTEGREISLPKP